MFIIERFEREPKRNRWVRVGAVIVDVCELIRLFTGIDFLSGVNNSKRLVSNGVKQCVTCEFGGKNKKQQIENIISTRCGIAS